MLTAVLVITAALIMDLAAQSALGRQIGAYYMIRGIFVSMTPLIGGILWGWNPTNPFILGGAVSMAGFLWFVLGGMSFWPGNKPVEVSTRSTAEEK